jgi:hypothetical protein
MGTIGAPRAAESSTAGFGALTLTLHYETLIEAVRTACSRVFQAPYPVTMRAASDLLPETSAQDAIKTVRALVAPIIKGYLPASERTESRVFDETIRLEERLASMQDVRCDLPGHAVGESIPNVNDARLPGLLE